MIVNEPFPTFARARPASLRPISKSRNQSRIEIGNIGKYIFRRKASFRYVYSFYIYTGFLMPVIIIIPLHPRSLAQKEETRGGDQYQTKSIYRAYVCIVYYKQG